MPCSGSHELKRLYILERGRHRTLLDSIDTGNIAGLLNCALIGLMVLCSARNGAALGIAIDDLLQAERRLRVRLREKGGKRHAMPCQHNLESRPGHDVTSLRP